MAGKSLRDRAIDRLKKKTDFDPPGGYPEAAIDAEVEKIKAETAAKTKAKDEPKARKTTKDKARTEQKPKKAAKKKEPAAVKVEEPAKIKEPMKVQDKPKPSQETARRGPGQPRKYEKTVGISFKLPIETVDLMRDLSMLENCSRTDLIIDLIADAAEARRDKILALRELRE